MKEIKCLFKEEGKGARVMRGVARWVAEKGGGRDDQPKDNYKKTKTKTMTKTNTNTKAKTNDNGGLHEWSLRRGLACLVCKTDMCVV